MKRESLTAKRVRAAAVFTRLRETYADARCSLDHRSSLELLVLTILAAQCTDERVNIVAKTLFKKYRKPEDFLAAPQEELEREIHSCGFYRQKAKSIRRTCARLIEVYDGQVPSTMEELLTLDGVGRKTANVLLGEYFGTAGIIVDTHCMRLGRRLGFHDEEDPVKIETALMKVWAREDWTLFSHCLVFHGRAVCRARDPQCGDCVVADLCPSAFRAETRPKERTGAKRAR